MPPSRRPQRRPASSRHPGTATGNRPSVQGLAGVPHEVRIIGGIWKRTPLPVPDKAGLRPTPSRVRERLFNWLGQQLTGWRCIDAFAGSGALGFEAASRGATEVWLVEQDASLVASLRRTAERLNATSIRVERADAIGVLRSQAGRGWDLILLDPPFGSDNPNALFTRALQSARAAVHDTRGLIYLESPRAWTDAELSDLSLAATHRGQAGMVHHALLQPLGSS